MLGWSISASACRSASKRASTCLESMPGLDQLERDQALDRLGLLGHPDRAHAAFADLLQQLVAASQNAARPRARALRRMRSWRSRRGPQGFPGNCRPPGGRRSNSRTPCRRAASAPHASSRNASHSAIGRRTAATNRSRTCWGVGFMDARGSGPHPQCANGGAGIRKKCRKGENHETPRTARWIQAFAYAQCSYAVDRGMSAAIAASSIVRPAK